MASRSLWRSVSLYSRATAKAVLLRASWLPAQGDRNATLGRFFVTFASRIDKVVTSGGAHVQRIEWANPARQHQRHRFVPAFELNPNGLEIEGDVPLADVALNHGPPHGLCLAMQILGLLDGLVGQLYSDVAVWRQRQLDRPFERQFQRGCLGWRFRVARDGGQDCGKAANDDRS